jgi:hypothetical protein
MAWKPLVTVLITSYNYARYLGEAIDSALGQSYPRVEVVVVDDGSTDDSPAVIARYGGRVVRLFKPNGGQASALNTGLAASRGDLVLTLDADDRLSARAVERVVEAWAPGVAKVQYRLRVVDAAGRPRGGCVPDARVAMPSGDLRPLVLSRFVYPAPPTSGNAYARDLLARTLPVPEREWSLTADAYFATSLAFLGRVVSIQEPLGDYRVHGANGWACAPEDATRLAHLVAHARQREALVRRLAAERGLPVPADLTLRDAYCAALRLALRVTAPERDPEPERSGLGLAARGILAALRHPCGGPARRAALAAWFALLPLLPRAAGRRLALAALARKRAALASPPDHGARPRRRAERRRPAGEAGR